MPTCRHCSSDYSQDSALFPHIFFFDLTLVRPRKNGCTLYFSPVVVVLFSKQNYSLGMHLRRASGEVLGVPETSKILACRRDNHAYITNRDGFITMKQQVSCCWQLVSSDAPIQLFHYPSDIIAMQIEKKLPIPIQYQYVATQKIYRPYLLSC